MTATWFTADTHFSHKLVAELRGFKTPLEHDDAIVDNWNSVVAKGDTVWHLGDVGMGSLDRFVRHLSKLNGRIHLIAGNHDICAPIHRDAHKHQKQWLTLRFDSVQAYARMRIRSRQVLLSHYPYSGDHTDEDRFMQYRLRNEGLWLLHGHTHSSYRYGQPHQIHIGLDAWDLKPVSMDVIADAIEKSEANE